MLCCLFEVCRGFSSGFASVAAVAGQGCAEQGLGPYNLGVEGDVLLQVKSGGKGLQVIEHLQNALIGA